MIRYFIISVLLLMPNLVSASNLNGRYVVETHSCDNTDFHPDKVLLIKGNEFYIDEMTCTLQSKTSVRGMDASLFDAKCSQEGNDFNYRVMFMKIMDKGIYMVGDGWVDKFLRCK